MPEKIKALWNLALLVECPDCKAIVDLLDMDDFWDHKPNDFNILHRKENDVYCPKCGHEFVCDFDY